MKISNEMISEISSRNDIVEVLGEYLNLRKNGDNYSALCPFHREKTPSFVVSRNKQIFKCFGCGESGNVISFIMKYKGVNFIESIKLLSDRVGILLDLDSSKVDLNKYYKILNDAARYFYMNLKKNKNVKQYLIDRGLSDSIITKFGIGYSSMDFGGLNRFLSNKGYNNDDLLELGLISKKSRFIYDKFINRIMFPIFSNTGKVIGFGGRVIDNSLPKYLNSKDSIIFKKGNNLYGLNFLLRNSKKFDYIIIVEGYMDCISLHNSGITNVVACLGTSLTVDQIKLLTKYTSKLYLCFDSDDAGKKAVIRTFNLFRSFINDSLLEVYVLELYGVKDPDEFLKGNTPDIFFSLLNNSRDLIEYILDNYRFDFDLKSNFGKNKYLHKVSEIINDLNMLDKHRYINIVSKYLSVNEGIINSYLEGNVFKLNLIDENYESSFVDKAYLKSERQLLNLMLNKEYLTYILNNNVDEDLFFIEEHRKVFNLITNFTGQHCDILDYLETKLTTYEEIKLLVYFKENLNNYDKNNIVSQINDFIMVIKKNIISNFKEKIAHIIKEYESKANEDKVIDYLSVLNIVSKLERENNFSEAVDFIRSFRV